MPAVNDMIGSIIAGRYRVRRKLGQGGMGAVWLVQHTESLQMFALKTLHAPKGDGFDRMTLERFLREARAAAALRSRNVVKVIDAQMNYVNPATNAPMPFIVMELLEGQTLDERLGTHGPLPAEQVLWMLKQVARALELAHQKGIVHRDLKPENLFLALDEDGEPIAKVCDFGIAKLGGELGEGMMATSTEGAFLGTPLYMSPEQAKSASAVVPQSDQWALGLIAFKALTGRDYFASAKSAPELILKIAAEPMVPPTVLASSLPKGFDAWFARSCARDPNERWSGVGEQIGALGEAIGVTREEATKLDLAAVRIVTTLDANPSAPTEHQPSTVSERKREKEKIENAETKAPLAERVPSTTTNGPNSASAAPLTTATKRSGRLAWVTAIVVVAGIAGTVIAMRAREGKDATTSTTNSAPATASSTTTTTVIATATASATATESATASAMPSTMASTMSTSKKTIPSPTAKTKPTVTATATATTTKPAPAALKPKGAACARSSECASGFCVAEECT